MKSTDKILNDALIFLKLIQLPEPLDKEDGSIWVKALAKVEKRSGRIEYVVIKRYIEDFEDKTKVIKDFGSSSPVQRIIEIYPITFVTNIPSDVVKKAEVIEYIISNRKDVVADEVRALKGKKLEMMFIDTLIRKTF